MGYFGGLAPGLEKNIAGFSGMSLKAKHLASLQEALRLATSESIKGQIRAQIKQALDT